VRSLPHTTPSAAAATAAASTPTTPTFPSYTADMDPEARRRACVEFRVKLSWDTGTNLSAADCEELLGGTFGGPPPREQIILQSNPGLFYASLGAAIASQTLPLVIPNYMKVAWWCCREAADVYSDPTGMGMFGECYSFGRGVPEDPARAVAWFDKAVDLGDAGSQYSLGCILMNGDVRSGVRKDAVRGFALLREAVEQGFSPAVFQVALCYLKGGGVEKDAAHRMALLRQVITQGYDVEKVAEAQSTPALCYLKGGGVEANTVQAAVWCQRAADGGEAQAIQLLPVIRTCDFCGTTPARQHCDRCQKVRYCSAACLAQHWSHTVNPHKGHCRTAAAPQKCSRRRWAARPRQRSRNVLLRRSRQLLHDRRRSWRPTKCKWRCDVRGLYMAVTRGASSYCQSSARANSVGQARPQALRPLPEGALLRRRVPGAALDSPGAPARGALPPLRGCISAGGGRRV